MWRAAATNQHRPPLPWLVLPDGTFFSFPASCAAFQFPSTRYYHGSCDDWLLFDHGQDGYQLQNPFSGETMRLPGLNCVHQAFSNSVVLAWTGIIVTVGNNKRFPNDMIMQKMVMCPGNAVAAIVGDGWLWLRDIAFYNGKLYAVEDNGDLLEMTVCENDCTGEPMVESTIMRVIWDYTRTVLARDGVETPVMWYLLVSGGSLLMVCRVLKEDGTSVFSMFKANLASLRWSEIRSIGDDVALFVSRWCSFVRRMSYYKLPRNRIYFLDNDDNDVCRGHHFGVYNMLDDVTYPLLPQLSELRNGRGNTPATWLVPRY
ncbi:hypothetical protein QOZ80_9BG0714830 [Eleusine coracana subsp. coracana]|nr:hypothetical protein QOZ80_9BG0714830 [Eleusine coracana subsp. coracana]